MYMTQEPEMQLPCLGVSHKCGKLSVMLMMKLDKYVEIKIIIVMNNLAKICSTLLSFYEIHLTDFVWFSTHKLAQIPWS